MKLSIDSIPVLSPCIQGYATWYCLVSYQTAKPCGWLRVGDSTGWDQSPWLRDVILPHENIIIPPPHPNHYLVVFDGTNQSSIISDSLHQEVSTSVHWNTGGAFK
jgi:hypothetical protein